MQFDITNFDAAAFVTAYPDNYIIFMTGGWDQTNKYPYYKGLMCYGPHRKKIERSLSPTYSPNAAMLIGAIDACSQLKKTGTILYLITPTPLGFVKGTAGNGPHVELLQEILRICKEKMIILHDIDIYSGNAYIRDIIDGKITV